MPWQFKVDHKRPKSRQCPSSWKSLSFPNMVGIIFLLSLWNHPAHKTNPKVIFGGFLPSKCTALCLWNVDLSQCNLLSLSYGLLLYSFLTWWPYPGTCLRPETWPSSGVPFSCNIFTQEGRGGLLPLPLFIIKSIAHSVLRAEHSACPLFLHKCPNYINKSITSYLSLCLRS